MGWRWRGAGALRLGKMIPLRRLVKMGPNVGRPRRLESRQYIRTASGTHTSTMVWLSRGRRSAGQLYVLVAALSSTGVFSCHRRRFCSVKHVELGIVDNEIFTLFVETALGVSENIAYWVRSEASFLHRAWRNRHLRGSRRGQSRREYRAVRSTQGSSRGDLGVDPMMGIRHGASTAQPQGSNCTTKYSVQRKQRGAVD